jgi:signal transduction histidine kinase
MRRASSACCSSLLIVALLASSAALAALQPRTADLSTQGDPGPPSAREWRQVDLPASTPARAARFRVDFQVDKLPAEEWAVYLPYLYGGARVLLNGVPLARIRESTADTVVRWERPHLLPVPPLLLRTGSNRIEMRLVATPVADVRVPQLQIGPASELEPLYERRLFWTRTMSQFTVAACAVVGTLSLSIWARRREEVLYGLFGAASLLWGLRTLTFVVEVLPSATWHLWRIAYYTATGGFAIAMLLFAMHLSGLRTGRLKWLLVAYCALGPLGYAATGANEMLIARFWVGGLLPIGAAVVVLSAMAAWRCPTAPLLALSVSLAIAVLAGMHDYLMAAAPAVLASVAPGLASERLFLLGYAADLLLVAMGVVLAARFVSSLETVEQLNRTLETRIAESRHALAANYERIVGLERRQAALRERQDIMRDLHDGLGSSLSVTLSRAESGAMAHADIVDALRDCLADMRLTLEALGPEQDDFLQAWSSFRFRWQRLLEGAGLESRWELTTSGESLLLAPLVTTQLLRIVQEALTNVVKHAGAGHVAVRLHADADLVRVEVADDGGGLPGPAGAGSHGLANMRARAARIGARLQVVDGGPGVQVLVTLTRDVMATVP